MSCRNALAFSVAQDLFRFEALQFGDVERCERSGDLRVRDCIGKDEGEVAPDGLEARQLTHGRLAQVLFVEAVERELADVDGLPELAALCFCRMHLAEVTDGGPIYHGARGAAWMQPGRHQTRAGWKTVKVEQFCSELAQQFFHAALDVVEVERAGRLVRAFERQAARGADGKRGPFLHSVR